MKQHPENRKRADKAATKPHQLKEPTMRVTTPQTEQDHAIYCTARSRIIDHIPRLDDAQSRLERLTPEYGDSLIILPFDEAWDRFEATFKSGPVEITAERFDEMLSILPPVAWKTDHDGESFKICERIAGTVTSIFVRIGTRFVTFSDDIRTPHAECCRRARVHLAATDAPTP
jgi:hypothetical protein